MSEKLAAREAREGMLERVERLLVGELLHHLRALGAEVSVLDGLAVRVALPDADLRRLRQALALTRKLPRYGWEGRLGVEVDEMGTAVALTGRVCASERRACGDEAWEVTHVAEIEREGVGREQVPMRCRRDPIIGDLVCWTREEWEERRCGAVWVGGERRGYGARGWLRPWRREGGDLEGAAT